MASLRWPRLLDRIEGLLAVSKACHGGDPGLVLTRPYHQGMGRGGQGAVSGAATATRRGAARERPAFERDPRSPYEVREEEDEPGVFRVNWGYYGMRDQEGLVRWVTEAEGLSEDEATRLFELGDEVCAAVEGYSTNVRPGDTAGVRSEGLGWLLGNMGTGSEMRIRATPLPSGGFEIRNYDVRDDWCAVVGAPA